MPYLVSPEERVNSYTLSRQSAPFTVALPNGDYLTVWSGQGEGDLGYGIFLQRYNSDGDRVGGEVRVNTATLYSQQDPAVTVLASGGYAVTWDTTVPGGQPGDPALLGIFAQAFDAGGTRVGPETQVSGAGYQQQVTGLPDGGYLVTWTQTVAGSSSGVLARRFDASAQATGPAFILNTDLLASDVSTTATDDGFIAVWRAYANGQHTIAVQTFDLTGARIGAEVRIPRDGDQTAPDIVRLTGGDFALVWYEATGLYAQILGEDGQPSGARTLVQATNGGGQLLHSVVATPDGGFTVAWDQFSRGLASTAVRAFNADGSANGETVSVRAASGSPGEPPGLTVLTSGDVVVTYARYVGDVTNYFDVFQVRLEPLVRTQTGAATADQLTGRDGVDHLFGLGGDDVLIGGLGNDVLDGGAGQDEVVFTGSADDYRIFDDGGGVFRVKGLDGFDVLRGVERLRFDDRTIDLTLIVCDPPVDGDAKKGTDASPMVLPGPADWFAKDAGDFARTGDTALVLPLIQPVDDWL